MFWYFRVFKRFEIWLNSRLTNEFWFFKFFTILTSMFCSNVKFKKLTLMMNDSCLFVSIAKSNNIILMIKHSMTTLSNFEIEYRKNNTDNDFSNIAWFSIFAWLWFFERQIVIWILSKIDVWQLSFLFRLFRRRICFEISFWLCFEQHHSDVNVFLRICINSMKRFVFVIRIWTCHHFDRIELLTNTTIWQNVRVFFFFLSKFRNRHQYFHSLHVHR